MTRPLPALRAVACAALVAFGAAAQAAELTLAPATTNLLPGASFSLDVDGSSFAGNIIGGGFDLRWDPALLRLDARAIDTAVWPDPARFAGLLDPVAGTLTGVFFNSNAAVLPTGSFHVARLDFTALAAGTSLVELLANPALPFANDLAEAVEVNFGSASVTAVPEPGAWALMALGLVGLALRRRAARGHASA